MLLLPETKPYMFVIQFCLRSCTRVHTVHFHFPGKMLELAESFGVPNVKYTMLRSALVAACLLESAVPLLTAVELVYDHNCTPASIKGWSKAVAVEVLRKASPKKRRVTSSDASGSSRTTA